MTWADTAYLNLNSNPFVFRQVGVGTTWTHTATPATPTQSILDGMRVGMNARTVV